MRSWMADIMRLASVVMTAALGTHRSVSGSFHTAHTPAIARTASSGGWR